MLELIKLLILKWHKIPVSLFLFICNNSNSLGFSTFERCSNHSIIPMTLSWTLFLPSYFPDSQPLVCVILPPMHRTCQFKNGKSKIPVNVFLQLPVMAYWSCGALLVTVLQLDFVTVISVFGAGRTASFQSSVTKLLKERNALLL